MKACELHTHFFKACVRCRAENFPPPRASHDVLMSAPQHAADLQEASKWLKLVVHLVPLGVTGPGALADADALAARLNTRAAAIVQGLPK